MLGTGGSVKQKYEWENDLTPFVHVDKITTLKELIDNKIRIGRSIKWLIIVGDIIFILIIVLFIGFSKKFDLSIDVRVGFIAGIIAFELAIVTFFSPINVQRIEKNEVNNIIDQKVTNDIMKKITKSVEDKTSNTQKWLGFIGACGVFATIILKVLG